MYVKFVHDVEYERSVVFIHEGVVAGAYAHQRLFLFHYEWWHIFNIFFSSIDDGRLELCV